MTGISSLAILVQAAPAAEPPAYMSFLPLVGMAVIFWFLILRPQMKRQKEHQTKIAGLKKGDQVVTEGAVRLLDGMAVRRVDTPGAP